MSKRLFFSTEHFSLNEFVRSATAKRLGIDNTPTEEAVDNLRFLTEELLEPLRVQWGRPIRVNSGYRSEALNRAVGGSRTSQHMRGEAADISAESPVMNNRLMIRLLFSGLPFDQLIAEEVDEMNCPRWLHVSIVNRQRGYGNTNRKNRHEVLVKRKAGVVPYEGWRTEEGEEE